MNVLCPPSLVPIQIMTFLDISVLLIPVGEFPKDILTTLFLADLLRQPIRASEQAVRQSIPVTIVQKADIPVEVQSHLPCILVTDCQFLRFDRMLDCQEHQDTLGIVLLVLESIQGTSCQMRRFALVMNCRRHRNRNRLLLLHKPGSHRTKFPSCGKTRQGRERHFSRPFLCTNTATDASSSTAKE